MRNVAITTVAPTGSISMLADVSSGVEPLFALAYVKGVVEETGLTYVNSYFQKELEGASWADGGPEHKVRDRIIREISASGTVAQISGVPSGVKKVYRTAHDISPEWHVKMQSVWQEWTDNAVSKTINFPNSATIDDVGRAYMLAWKAGCKGITIYRDGSREYQVLTVGKQGESGKKPIIQSRVRLASLKERKSGGRCPECETKLVVEEGCSKCYGCGYSVCTG